MKTSIFVDGISNIVMVDGVVRFDMVTLLKSPQAPQQDNTPVIEKVASVATTVPGFLRMHEQMAGVVRNMIDQGILKKTTATDGAKVDAVDADS